MATMLPKYEIGQLVKHKGTNEKATVKNCRVGKFYGIETWFYTLDFGRDVLVHFGINLQGGEFVEEGIKRCNQFERIKE